MQNGSKRKKPKKTTKKAKEKKMTPKKELCRLHSFFQKGNDSGVAIENCPLCCVDFSPVFSTSRIFLFHL
jgi:hypothetical protein